MNFEQFKISLAQYYYKNDIINAIPNDTFLQWFVGFSEGDGSFVINKRKELQFILVQGSVNKVLLDNVYSILRLGRVLKQGIRTHRLVIQRREQLELILILFNGNIMLPSKKTQFNKFFDAFYKKKQINGGQALAYVKTNIRPSKFDAWLLGFTEAEGSFSASLLKNSNAYRTRFVISQKHDVNLPVLSSLIILFGAGFIDGHHVKDNYSFIVSNLTNVKHIYEYFDRYLDNFLGIKRDSYLKFKALNAALVQQLHLSQSHREEVRQLANDVSAAHRKFK